MLSLADLLAARDLYHVHLMNKDNVVATAVGRYLIRKSDPWPGPHGQDHQAGGNGHGARRQRKKARTLENSEVRPYSWPCVLVFVEKWRYPDDFGSDAGRLDPSEMIPWRLDMPDGTSVPVCVVQASLDEVAQPTPLDLVFPDHLIGGGYPIIADVQGQEHVASIGCLVTDGHLVYALTNRHVSGQPGERIYTRLGGSKIEIGRSSDKSLTRLPFAEVYAPWPGKKVFANLDIGLVAINDRSCWTAQVYGIGQVGKMVDLSSENLSLRLLECPVRAYGCASHEMYGQISALFYRYKSAGGFEYVADFLIGPRASRPFATHPGDSGTLWLLDADDLNQKQEGPRPVAVQWGGHVFVDDEGKRRQSYALATCLSTVCNLLEVDVIRDWNIGQPDYWGNVGHYTIANKAINLVTSEFLKKLMQANHDFITFGDIGPSGVGNQPARLADIPDLVWKMGRFSRSPNENPNHFADMDKPKPDGTTLLDICRNQPENVAVPVWRQYCDDVGLVKPGERGLLPFRVWQFYQEMVTYVKAGQALEFVCAAGILAHYVGDACQPLHISYMFDGDPADLVPGHDKPGNPVQVPRAAGVHHSYEGDMVNRHITDIIQGVDEALATSANLPLVQGGHGAAVATVELMQKTFDKISPRAIINVYLQAKDSGPTGAADALWSQFGDATVEVITLGTQYLAMIWTSAWQEGGGDQTIQDLGPVNGGQLSALYQSSTFLPSCYLDDIGRILT